MNYPLDKLKSNGISALAIASIKGNLPIMKLLVNSGADINLIGKSGVSPLYMAMKAQNLDCIQYLLEQGAQIFINDPIWNEMSPIFYCIRLNNPIILNMVVDSIQGKYLHHMRTGKGFTPV
jgi:ankyrin repeat protein